MSSRSTGSEGRPIYTLDLDVSFADPADMAGDTIATAFSTNLSGSSGQFSLDTSLQPNDIDLYRLDALQGTLIDLLPTSHRAPPARWTLSSVFSTPPARYSLAMTTSQARPTRA